MKKSLLILSLLAISMLFAACPAGDKTDDTAVTIQPEVTSQPVPAGYAAKTKRPSDAVLAPNFTIDGLKGGKVTLYEHKGKIIILDFWATWCPPCKAEIPDFIALQNQYRSSGLVIIGAAIDDPNKVANFAKKAGINYIVGLATQDTASIYGGVRGIPTTFVIDREGYIVRQYVGFRPKETFEQDVKDLM